MTIAMLASAWQSNPSGKWPSDRRKASSAGSTCPSSKSDWPRLVSAMPLSGWRAAKRRKLSTAGT